MTERGGQELNKTVFNFRFRLTAQTSQQKHTGSTVQAQKKIPSKTLPHDERVALKRSCVCACVRACVLVRACVRACVCECVNYVN